MIKTTCAKECFVIVFSCLIVGCSPHLPELPSDFANTPNPIQVETLAPLNQAFSSDLSRGASYKELEVSFEEININKGGASKLQFVANDLVKALSYISGMGPKSISINTIDSDSEFYDLVKHSMVERGYRIDDNRLRPGNLRLTTSSIEANNDFQHRAMVAIMALDTVLIKRIYNLQGGEVKPNGSYVIRGIQAERVDANSQIIVRN